MMTNGDGVEMTIAVRTTSRAYDVQVGANLLDGLGTRLTGALPSFDSVFVVTDENVGPHYLERTLTSLAPLSVPVASCVVPAGETHKNLSTYGAIVNRMAEAELTRDSLVLALGGGVIGDMAGFAAATYMRGIRVVQVPTTLLAMVDSSVGGKTAIDIAQGKNLVGAFLQPSLVIADVQTLATLDDEVFADGLGEVVKHAVLADPALFDELEAQPPAKDATDAYLAHVVARNVAIKRDVVNTDEQERGLRQTLNLGHTIGHAIEAASGYTLGHGHCVAMGLCAIARAAEALGWSENGLAGRIERCVTGLGLPTDTSMDHQVLFEQATHDKKRHGDTCNVIIPERMGQCAIRTISLAQLRELIVLGCGSQAQE